MTITIGIDAGKSGIRGRSSLGDDIETSGITHDQPDSDTQLVEAVGVLAEKLAGQNRIDRIACGLTTLPSERRVRDELTAELQRRTGANSVVITGDEVASHAGAHHGATGAVVTVGTGVNALAINSDTGWMARYDGAGYLLGDEGGAYWIGQKGLRSVIASYDGRDRSTTLSSRAVELFGDIAALADHVHRLERPVETIAGFAREVLETANHGDPVAVEIIDWAAEKLAATTVAASNGLAASNAPDAAIVFTGRLFGAASLRRAVARELRAHSIEFSYLADSGLSGSLALASTDMPCYRPLLTESA